MYLLCREHCVFWIRNGNECDFEQKMWPPDNWPLRLIDPFISGPEQDQLSGVDCTWFNQATGFVAKSVWLGGLRSPASLALSRRVFGLTTHAFPAHRQTGFRKIWQLKPTGLIESCTRLKFPLHNSLIGMTQTAYLLGCEAPMGRVWRWDENWMWPDFRIPATAPGLWRCSQRSSRLPLAQDVPVDCSCISSSSIQLPKLAKTHTFHPLGIQQSSAYGLQY